MNIANIAKKNLMNNFITHKILINKDVKIAVKLVSKNLLTNKSKLDLFIVYDNNLRKINGYIADKLSLPQDKDNHVVTSDNVNDIISKLNQHTNKSLRYQMI